MQAGNKQITQSSHGPARGSATEGNPQVDLTDEMPSGTADHSAGPVVTQHSVMLRHPTHEEGEVPLFENSDKELPYPKQENTCLESQRELECLRMRVIGKNTYQCGELLDTLAQPPVHKQPTPAKQPSKCSTILPLQYGGHKQKDLAVSICGVEDVLEFDVAVYHIESNRIIFIRQYVIGHAVAVQEQYCAQHPEGDYTWATTKDLPYSRVALTKHCTDAAFQKPCSAKQGPDQTVTFFSAYIGTTCKGTDITDYNKRMFFWTRLHPEIRAAVRKGEDYPTLDACSEARVEEETALCLDGEYNKRLKSAPKEQAVEKVINDKSKGKAHHDSGKSRCLQGALQRSYGGFRGRRRGHGHSSHG